MKSRSTMVRSASPVSGSDFSNTATRRSRLVGDARWWLTSTNKRPPAGCMGAAAVSCQNEIPRGFMGSVIICWWPTDTYTWGPSSAAAGIGNSVVIGRLCTMWKAPSTRHHSMSCGRPKCASILRPSRANSTTCASVSAGCACRTGSIARCRVPPPGSASIASSFEVTIFWTISSSRTLNMSGLTRPDTSASPRPKLASTDSIFRLPLTGSAVNRMPDACGMTICCNTTAMCT